MCVQISAVQGEDVIGWDFELIVNRCGPFTVVYYHTSVLNGESV